MKHFLIRKNENVVLREEFDQWGILFNPDTSAVVGINAMGVDLWKSFDGLCDLETIVEKVRKEYDRIPEEAADQITGFVRELLTKGFLEQPAEENA